MRSTALLLPVLAFLPQVTAQAQTWWQCGGYSWWALTPRMLLGRAYHITHPLDVQDRPYYMSSGGYLSCAKPTQCVPECQVPSTTTIAVSSTIPVPTDNETAANRGIYAHNDARAALQRRATEVPIDIIALDGWAAGSYLQKARDSDAAILGQYTWMLFSQGENVRLRNPNISTCVSFLNLTTKTAEASYKPLVLGTADTVIDWSFNGPNSTLITSTGFNTFVACPGGDIYLQTGSDLPSENCIITRLQLKRA